jgi:hypothetical protein
MFPLVKDCARRAPVTINIAGTDEMNHVVHSQPLACHVMTRRIAKERRPSRARSLDELVRSPEDTEFGTYQA